MTQTSPLPPALPGGYLPPPPLPPPPQNNGMAIASLVLGIISLACCVCPIAIPGVIFGHVALGQIRRSGGMQVGQGPAVAGLVTGYIAIGVTLIFLVLYFLMFIGMIASAGHN